MTAIFVKCHDHFDLGAVINLQLIDQLALSGILL